MSKEPLRTRIETGAELSLEDWGKVIVEQPVGEGGMGVVHRGWLYYNPHGPRAGIPPHPVAVKVLHPMLRRHERARRLFLGEAAALQRLSHPNIVHFFGMAEIMGQLALVIEFVEGQALGQVIEQHLAQAKPGGLPCMPLVLAWHYFAQLLGALSAIHQLGIVHRDVKPGNVLIRTDGVVKLTDFGIARLPADEARKTGSIAPGTGAYMSPEQVVAGELDGRSDLYSAAIVLYEMLSGITPFEAPDRNEIMVRTAQVEESPLPLTRLVPQAPPVLDLLMARALAKDPMHRYATGLEFGEAIRTTFNLKETPGWTAQKRLAEHAEAISRLGTAQAPAPHTMNEAKAAAMRTEAMAAFAS